MKQLTYLTLLSGCLLCVLSCKKDKPADPQNTTFSVPTSVGSYWIYNWSLVGNDGTEIPLGIADTVRITGDSIINGNHYAISSGTYMGDGPFLNLRRDSSGYIVGPGGAIEYSYINTAMVLYPETYDGSFFDRRIQMGSNAHVSFPVLGDLKVVDVQQILKRDPTSTYPGTSGPGVNTCGNDSLVLHRYYASGIGKVRMEEIAYFSEFYTNCQIRRANLVEYHIVP